MAFPPSPHTHRTPAPCLLSAFLSSSKVDKIVVMGQLPGAEGATIVDQGTYDELVGRGRDLSNILEEQKAKEKTTEADVCMCACVCVCMWCLVLGPSAYRGGYGMSY